MLKSREGYWITTHTGKRVYPLEPLGGDFCIRDIAHGLSNISRYGGQCISFYSVAEHCIRGSRHAIGNAELQYEVLMHDSAEAYVGDAVRPLVMTMDSYREMRDRMQAIINIEFSLPPTMSPECEEIDDRMLATEGPVMFTHGDAWWKQLPHEPYANEWAMLGNRPRVGEATGTSNLPPGKMEDRQFWTPRMAERLFLAEYYGLRERLGLSAEP